MEEQGYKLKDSLVFQDNKSSILMEENGQSSCTGNARHINIHYFWIKDKVEQWEVWVAYNPTHMMLDDYFTKPLVGALFIKFHEYVMVWKLITDLFVSFDTNRIKEKDENRNKKRVICGYFYIREMHT